MAARVIDRLWEIGDIVALVEAGDEKSGKRGHTRQRLLRMTSSNHKHETLADFGFSGRSALEYLISKSDWGSLPQALASLSVFPHQDIIKAIGPRPLFRIRRLQDADKRMKIKKGDFDLQQNYMWDDNQCVVEAFKLATGLNYNSKMDLQCNHIYSNSADPNSYCDFRNLCLAPAFMSKLTDSQKVVVPDDHVSHLLRYRSFILYGYSGPDEVPPREPLGYRDLLWADPIGEGATAEQIERTFRQVFSKRAAFKLTIAAKKIGWAFSNFTPDHRIDA